jgi:hypothetical protein
MLNKIKQISKHLIYIIGTNIIYGLIVYFVFSWLTGYSLLYAYLGNLVLIISGLAIDNYSQKMFQSEKFIKQLKEDKNSEKNYRLFQWIIDNFVSFKAILYLFYIVILIISQLIKFEPALFSEDIRNFIGANDYSILFLISVDTVIGQFSNDKIKMKQISENFKKSWGED